MNDNLPTPPLQETERARSNYDVGFEDGHQARDLDELRASIRANLDELDRVLGRSTPQVRNSAHLRLIRQEAETDTDVPRLQATAKCLDIVLSAAATGEADDGLIAATDKS